MLGVQGVELHTKLAGRRNGVLLSEVVHPPEPVKLF